MNLLETVYITTMSITQTISGRSRDYSHGSMCISLILLQLLLSRGPSRVARGKGFHLSSSTGSAEVGSFVSAGFTVLLKDTSVGGGRVCAGASSSSIRVIKSKHLLLFPNKLPRREAALCDESAETKRQNVVFFHLSPCVSIFPPVFSQEEIIGAALRPVGSSSFIFSHINTLSHWASPLRPPKKGRRVFFLPSLSLQLSAAAHQPSLWWETKRIPSRNSPSPVHSGISPSRPWLLEVPDRSSRTFFVFHANCCIKRLPGWVCVAPEQGQMSSIFRLVLFLHCKNILEY